MPYGVPQLIAVSSKHLPCKPLLRNVATRQVLYIICKSIIIIIIG